MKLEKSEFENLNNIVIDGDLDAFNNFIKENNLPSEQADYALLKCLESYTEVIGYKNNQDIGATSCHYLSKSLSKELTHFTSMGVKEIFFKGDPLFINLVKEKIKQIDALQGIKIEYKSIFHLQIAKQLINFVEDKALQKSLVLAAEFLDLELVQVILKKLLNSSQDFSNALDQALNKAVKNDDIDICNLLLKHGAKQISDKNGCFPLHLAKSKEAVLLLAPTADINQPTVVAKYNQNHKASTPLHIAVGEGKFDVIEALFNQNVDSSKSNNNGETILHRAIFNFQILKLLIVQYRCANLINIQDNKGNTPLHLLMHSYISESSEMILYLIKQGADLSIANKNGETILHLLSSTSVNHDSKVYQAILLGSNINYQDYTGKIAAHYAAQNSNNLSWFNLLLNAGSDLSLQDIKGNNVLLTLTENFSEYSLDERYDETVLKLINNAKDINLANKEGNTCLHYLAKIGYIDGIKAAVEKGAAIDTANQYQQTPLLYALAHGRIDAVLYLKELGANLNLITQLETPQTEDLSSYFTRAAQTQCQLLFPQNDKDKQFSIYLAIIMLQYTRWSLTTQQEKEKYLDYFNSLQHLINQFGKDNFIVVVKKLMDEHKDSLDITNLIEKGAHTDISPISKPSMLSVNFLLKNKYELHMQNHGYVVNVKTLFGDISFWKILQRNYTDIYQELIAHIKSWPDTQEFNAIYCRGIHNPLELFEQYFSEAFQFIRKDLNLENKTYASCSVPSQLNDSSPIKAEEKREHCLIL